MQNKPNFRKSQMNVNPYNRTNYKKFIPLAGQKNKPNSNPIKPNCRKGKIDAKCVFTKDYKIFIPLAGYKNKAKTNPIQSQFQTGHQPPPLLTCTLNFLENLP